MSDLAVETSALTKRFGRQVAVALPVRAVPSPVGLRAVDLGLALRSHAAFLGQPGEHLDDVKEAPFAMRLPGRRARAAFST